MDIETVIGRFWEAASVGVVRLPTQEAASGLAAMLAGGRQVTMHAGISTLSGVRDPPIWTADWA